MNLYHGYLPWVFCICSLILSCICEQILFIWKQNFFVCEQDFLISEIFFINSQGRIQRGGGTRGTGPPLKLNIETFDGNLVFILHFILTSS